MLPSPSLYSFTRCTGPTCPKWSSSSVHEAPRGTPVTYTEHALAGAEWPVLARLAESAAAVCCAARACCSSAAALSLARCFSAAFCSSTYCWLRRSAAAMRSRSRFRISSSDFLGVERSA